MRNGTRIIVLVALLGSAGGSAFGEYPYTRPGTRGGPAYDPFGGTRIPGLIDTPTPFGGHRIPGMPSPYDPLRDSRIPGFPSISDPFGLQRDMSGRGVGPSLPNRPVGLSRKTDEDDRRTGAAVPPMSYTPPQTPMPHPHVPHFHVPTPHTFSSSAASSSGRSWGRGLGAAVIGGFAAAAGAVAAACRRATGGRAAKPVSEDAMAEFIRQSESVSTPPPPPGSVTTDRVHLGLGADGRAGAIVRDVPHVLARHARPD